MQRNARYVASRIQLRGAITDPCDSTRKVQPRNSKSILLSLLDACDVPFRLVCAIHMFICILLHVITILEYLSSSSIVVRVPEKHGSRDTLGYSSPNRPK